MNAEQMKTAHRMRTEDDASYADIAEHIGLEREDWHVVRDALKGYTPASPAPETKLGALVAKAHEEAPREEDLFIEGAEGQISAASGDRKLTEDEIDQCVEIYNRSSEIGFEEMGEALGVHWLTVQDALAQRGWAEPGIKMPTCSTATPEGAAQWAAEQAEMTRAAAAGERVR